MSAANRTDQAIAVLESAVKDDPTNTSARFRLSRLYRRAGRTVDGEREMAAFNHYKELGEKLDKTYRQLRGAVREK